MYSIVATARKKESLENLSVDLKLSLDVCDEESTKAAIKRTMELFGKIDVLINNAGYSFRSAVEELNIMMCQKLYDVNVFGMIRMMKAVLPIMRKQGSGRIINIGSISEKMTGKVNGIYCSTKHAVEAITEATRYEVMDKGIEVCVIEPGAMETNFFETLSKNSDENMKKDNSPYHKCYERDLAFRAKQKKSDVRQCAKRFVDILANKKLKMRYMIGVPFIYRLFTHLPDSLKEYGITNLNG